MEWFLHLSTNFDALSVVSLSLYSYEKQPGANMISSPLMPKAITMVISA